MPYITSFEQMAKEEGRAEGLRDGIASVVRLKFGDAGQVLMGDVMKIDDVERLKRLMVSIETAATLEDARNAYLG